MRQVEAAHKGLRYVEVTHDQHQYQLSAGGRGGSVAKSRALQRLVKTSAGRSCLQVEPAQRLEHRLLESGCFSKDGSAASWDFSQAGGRCHFLQVADKNALVQQPQPPAPSNQLFTTSKPCHPSNCSTRAPTSLAKIQSFKPQRRLQLHLQLSLFDGLDGLFPRSPQLIANHRLIGELIQAHHHSKLLAP